MFVGIRYQCYNIDTSKALMDKDLVVFVEAKDKMFNEFMAEKGYALFADGYDPEHGVRELFYKRAISA